jgi:predicted metalloprotease
VTLKMRLAFVTAWILLVLTSGCAAPAGLEADDRHPTFAPAEGQSRHQAVVRADLSDHTFASDCPVGQQNTGGGMCAPCDDYEGCFTDSAQMSYFFSLIVSMIRQYSAKTYESMPDVDQWQFVPLGESGSEGCTDENGDRAVYTDESYSYCPLDRTVYVGEQMMWHFYIDLGDAAPAVGIAHEWGHHLQNMVDLRIFNQVDAIRQENQADCVAGAWSAWLVAEGNMVQDDFSDIGSLLLEIGSIEGPDRDHGTVDERQESPLIGLAGGLSDCNDYFPDTPLVR